MSHRRKIEKLKAELITWERVVRITSKESSRERASARAAAVRREIIRLGGKP